MSRNFPNPTPRGEWLPTVPREPREPAEHKCGICYGPFGKSAIRCKNEPPTTVQIAPERPASHNLDQLLAELDEHDNPKENH